MGSSLCYKLSVMHCLIGNDAGSNFGTKSSGLKQLSNANLSNFGKDRQLSGIDKMFKETNMFLITVIKLITSPSPLTSAYDLCYDIYQHIDSCIFINFPARVCWSQLGPALKRCFQKI